MHIFAYSGNHYFVSQYLYLILIYFTETLRIQKVQNSCIQFDYTTPRCKRISDGVVRAG